MFVFGEALLLKVPESRHIPTIPPQERTAGFSMVPCVPGKSPTHEGRAPSSIHQAPQEPL